MLSLQHIRIYFRPWLSTGQIWNYQGQILGPIIIKGRLGPDSSPRWTQHFRPSLPNSGTSRPFRFPVKGLASIKAQVNEA